MNKARAKEEEVFDLKACLQRLEASNERLERSNERVEQDIQGFVKIVG